jgi:hypothetical protein
LDTVRGSWEVGGVDQFEETAITYAGMAASLKCVSLHALGLASVESEFHHFLILDRLGL